MNNYKTDLLEYVIKTCENCLELVGDNDDVLCKSIKLYISNNLGIEVDITLDKHEVLSSIRQLYAKRTRDIEKCGLVPLEQKLIGLDRNDIDNLNMVKAFIKKQYNIDIDNKDLHQSHDVHYVIDCMMSRLYY